MNLPELKDIIEGCRWCEPQIKIQYNPIESRVFILLATPQLCREYESKTNPSLRILRNLIEISGLQKFNPQPVPLLKCPKLSPTDERLSVCAPFFRNEVSILEPLAVIVSDSSLVKHISDIHGVHITPDPTPLNIPRILTILSHINNELTNEN